MCSGCRLPDFQLGNKRFAHILADTTVPAILLGGMKAIS
jgi:hypothetical protein